MGSEHIQNGQTTKIHALSSTYALPSIQILIPPMDELGKAVQFIVTQHNRFVSQLALFKPKNVSFCLDAKRTASQLQSSQVMHWLLYLMCIIYREILDGDEKLYKRHHICWVNRFERRINSTSQTVMGPVTPMDSRRRLTAFVEVSLLKHEVIETISESYACLQAAAPAFLQLAFSEPSLWPQNSTSMMVPLAHALVSSRGEINRFACTDVMSAIALGLPTLAMYDTSLDGMEIPKFCAMEYMHGCPTEFIVILVGIHNWRLQHPDMHHDGHWKSMEDRIKTLRQERDESDRIPADSAQMVIRLAVRESWRHATLIYFYMKICGARSDDPRVQTSVGQIIKLIESIRPDTSYNTFFFLQYLFVGICAQKEQHRKRVMERFTAPLQMDWGLLRVSMFARVLENLWHGIAINGQGITWNDYLSSRNAVIPVRV